MRLENNSLGFLRSSLTESLFAGADYGSLETAGLSSLKKINTRLNIYTSSRHSQSKIPWKGHERTRGHFLDIYSFQLISIQIITSLGLVIFSRGLETQSRIPIVSSPGPPPCP